MSLGRKRFNRLTRTMRLRHLRTRNSRGRSASGSAYEVPLEDLAWGRSGDKGDKANIGIIARKPEYLPWIAAKLTADYVGDRFAHFMTSPGIDRYYMPGLPALNFLLHNALGGGGIGV